MSCRNLNGLCVDSFKTSQVIFSEVMEFQWKLSSESNET